jgi:hypothetical protein
MWEARIYNALISMQTRWGGCLQSTHKEDILMKRLFIILVSVLSMAGLFVGPAMAQVFTSGVIPCGVPGGVNDCGLHPAATDGLAFGRMEVSNGGVVGVELTAAAPNTTYRVYVGNWIDGTTTFQFQFLGDCSDFAIGTITTRSDGDYVGRVITCGGARFIFPQPTHISQLNFAFYGPTGPQFTTGIDLD